MKYRGHFTFLLVAAGVVFGSAFAYAQPASDTAVPAPAPVDNPPAPDAQPVAPADPNAPIPAPAAPAPTDATPAAPRPMGSAIPPPDADEILRIEISASPTEITVGDEVTYSITVTWNPKLQLEQKALEENLGDLVVRKQLGMQTATLPDGRTQRTESYVITSYLVGKYKLPPPIVRFSDAGGTHMLAAEPIFLNVRSVAPEDATEIRDIKPPRTVWRDMRQVGMYASIAFAGLMALITGVWFLIRRRRSPEAVEPPELPYDRAIRRLEGARALPRADHDEIKAYYVEIVGTLREYLDGLFNIPAPLLTTYQLRNYLRDHAQPDWPDDRLLSVFESADYVKFAKSDPDEELQSRDLEDALAFVRATRPPDTPESAPEAHEESDTPGAEGDAA